MGPIDYSTNYVCALLIDGFEHPPTLLTPHNPPYYGALIEGCGFRKEMDWYAWWFDQPHDARRRLRRISARFAGSLDVTIREVNMKDIAGESRRLREIYNRAWEKNWGFVPFTAAEFDHLIRELKPLAKPEYTLIAEVDGKPAGFLLYLPDINVALRHLPDGRLFKWGLPIGLTKLLYYKNRIKTGRLVALGVVPEFRRHGVAEKLVLRIIEEAMIKNGVTGECSLTLENNRLINRFLEAIGADRYKTYRIYQRPIEPAR
jgi:GNAT superfamily N-acetyltransferase